MKAAGLPEALLPQPDRDTKKIQKIFAAQLSYTYSRCYSIIQLKKWPAKRSPT